jgi:hypothetical protein
MPVPFRDAEEVAELGAAGYLKIVALPDGGEFRGALFLINARGEPLEFTYNRIQTPSTFLWRQDDIRRHAVRKLTTSLLDTCPKIPQFIICMAEEVHNELFCNELHLSIPVCRVASLLQATPHSKLEIQATIESPEPMHLFWFPFKPPDESIEERLVNQLIARGLLLEPFERAMVGLREVYPSETGQAKT